MPELDLVALRLFITLLALLVQSTNADAADAQGPDSAMLWDGPYGPQVLVRAALSY